MRHGPGPQGQDSLTLPKAGRRVWCRHRPVFGVTTMRLLSSLVLAALPAATAATAQSLAEGYRAAYAIFGNTAQDRDSSHEAVEALLPQLEGHWISLSAGAETPPDPARDAELFAERCNRFVLNLVRTGRLGFDLVLTSLADGGAERGRILFDHAGYSTFLRVQRNEDWLATHGIDEDEPLPPYLHRFLAESSVVTLYHPSPDILVMLDAVGMAEYYGRCP